MFRPVSSDDFHQELRRDRITVEASILATLYSSVEVLCVRSRSATRTDFNLFYNTVMMTRHRYLNNSTVVALDVASKTNQYFSI